MQQLEARPVWSRPRNGPRIQHSVFKKPDVPDDPDEIEPRVEFQFINDSVFQPTAPASTFSCFSQLPPELRLRIWSLALPSQRFLRLTISDADNHSPASSPSCARPEGELDPESNKAPYKAENSLGNVVSGANYTLRLRSSGSFSPLLYVNREAYNAVSAFYRVHIPVMGHPHQAYGSSTRTPCLRFCPEVDTICISFDCKSTGRDNINTALFADFIHDASAYDPLNAGIRHIGIERGKKPQIRLLIDPKSIHDRAHASLVRTIGSLHSVSLLQLIHGEARRMWFSLQQARLLPEPLSAIRSSTDEIRFNRAFPVWCNAASVSVLKQDPRPNTSYLDLVGLGYDPRALISAWRTLETTYGLPPTTPEKIRILVAAGNEKYEISSKEKARRFRQQEEDLWKSRFMEGGFFQRSCDDLNQDTEERLEYAQLKNAIGFWSLPVGAFGDPLDVDNDTYRWENPTVFDLREFESQIELGLFELP